MDRRHLPGLALAEQHHAYVQADQLDQRPRRPLGEFFPLVGRPLQRLGKIQGPEYALAFAAAEFLVARAGEDSLIRFWRLSAQTGAWRAAFLRAFGSSVARFEVAFERYRAAGFGS